MNENGNTLVEQLHLEAVRNMPWPPVVNSEPATIHWTELPEDKSGRHPAVEWNTYRGLVGRLLAEGHEGRWVLMQGEQLFGFWSTKEEALAEGYRLFLQQPFFVHQVQERERLLRIGYYRRCS